MAAGSKRAGAAAIAGNSTLSIVARDENRVFRRLGGEVDAIVAAVQTKLPKLRPFGIATE